MDERNIEVVEVPLKETVLDRIFDEVGIVPLMGVSLLIIAGGAIGGVIGMKMFIQK
jgi:hypothetical protein